MRALVLAALLLGACNKDNRSDICPAMFPPRYPTNGKTADDVKKNYRSCVMHWAARLSRAPDAAPIVANAALAGCTEARDQVIDAYTRERGAISGVSENATLDKEVADLALFTVVQARAGQCPLPGLGPLPK